MFETYAKAAITTAAALLFAWAFYRHRQDGRVREAKRAGYLDEVKPLFEGGLKAIKPDGFPRISGTYRGHTFDIQTVPDALNIRKLPALWLLVTLPEPLPLTGTFDVMMRPRGVEPFSNFASLPVQIVPDQLFPHDCAIRTDAPDLLPPRDVLQRHIGLFDDQHAKELVLSPKGLRVVWLAEEAHRGKYLIFRDSEMGLAPLNPRDLQPLLDYLIAFRADLLATTARAPT